MNTFHQPLETIVREYLEYLPNEMPGEAVELLGPVNPQFLKQLKTDKADILLGSFTWMIEHCLRSTQSRINPKICS